MVATLIQLQTLFLKTRHSKTKFYLTFSDVLDNRVFGSYACRSDGQPYCSVRGSQTCPDAHLSKYVHCQLGRVRYHTVSGVHAVYAHVVTTAQVDHGLIGVQACATLGGHKHHGVGGHHHGDCYRPVLGDRPRLRAKRTPHRVRVHSRRLAVGHSDHVSRGLFSGEANIILWSYYYYYYCY